MALLNRDSAKAKFWTYELYHSGFQKETIELLWAYYYLLYGGFFVNLERFLLRMTKEWLVDNKNDVIVGIMVENMANRETCIEFYRIIRGEIRGPDHMETYFRKIRRATDMAKCCEITEQFIEAHGCFQSRGQEVYQRMRYVFTALPSLPLETFKSACISRMFTGMFLLEPQNGFDDRMNIMLEPADVAKYKNKPFVQRKVRLILRRACLYKLDLEPDYKEIEKETHIDNWLVNASASPIWLNRIKKYGGSIVDDTVVFANENDEETFHNWYNMEPDEQPLIVKEKWMGTKSYASWSEIYEKYACAPFNEWIGT
jgi:hypothetical protein